VTAVGALAGIDGPSHRRPAPNGADGSTVRGHLRAVGRPAGDGGPAIRVVIADDDASIRTLLRMLLDADARIEVVAEAGDGVEALAVLSEVQADLLLLDLAMPRMNGLDVLRALEGTEGPGVVVLTGFNDVNVRDQSLRAGALRFVTKGDGFHGLPDELVALADEFGSPDGGGSPSGR
jgi:CheY-like chemotaxis protein